MTGFVTFEKASNRDRGSTGSTRIRSTWVHKYWPEAEEWIIGRKYDALIFQKVYWDEMMENFKGVKILDMCDPDWMEGRDVMQHAHLVDAITTSTEPLAEYMRKIVPGKLVKCIPDRIDLKAHTTIKKTHRKKFNNLVWFGYAHNAHYLEPTFDYLEGKTLTIYSDTMINPPSGCKVELKWKKYEYKKLHSKLIEFDAALMPVRSDYKAQFKSNNKRLTCKALGLPIIEVPEDLERLKDKQSREESAKIGLKEIKDKWNCKLSVQEYKDIIKQCQKK